MDTGLGGHSHIMMAVDMRNDLVSSKRKRRFVIVGDGLAGTIDDHRRARGAGPHG